MSHGSRSWGTTTKIRFATRVGPVAKRAKTVRTPESDDRADEILELRRRVLAIEPRTALTGYHRHNNPEVTATDLVENIDKKRAILEIARQTPTILDELHVGYTKTNDTTDGEPMQVAGLILLSAVTLAEGPLVKNFIGRVVKQFEEWDREGLPNGLRYSDSLSDYMKKIRGRYSLERFLIQDVRLRLAEIALLRGDPAVIDAVLSCKPILNQGHHSIKPESPKYLFKGTLLHVFVAPHHDNSFSHMKYAKRDVSGYVALLLKYGIDISITNSSGKTALQCYLDRQTELADELKHAQNQMRTYIEESQAEIATLQAQLDKTEFNPEYDFSDTVLPNQWLQKLIEEQ